MSAAPTTPPARGTKRAAAELLAAPAAVCAEEYLRVFCNYKMAYECMVTLARGGPAVLEECVRAGLAEEMERIGEREFTCAICQGAIEGHADIGFSATVTVCHESCLARERAAAGTGCKTCKRKMLKRLA